MSQIFPSRPFCDGAVGNEGHDIRWCTDVKGVAKHAADWF